MKLIKKLGTRLSKNGKSKSSWGLFQCTINLCNKLVEKQLNNGYKAFSCGSSKCNKNKGNYKHGGSYTRLYNIWHGIKARILNINNKDYLNYGGRGIKVCDEWLEFIPFRDWALNNGYANNLVIDRKKPDGNYEPNNCRWITLEESNRNKNNTITLEKANEIRELHETGNYTQKELAIKYNKSTSNICNIINNKKWVNNV